MRNLLVNSQGKAYIVNGQALTTIEDGMVLVRHWDGADAPSSGRWYDKVANQYWTLTSATHGTDYYQFTNASATSATSYGLLNGNLPDLHYHWKVVADIGLKYDTTNGAIAIDFGSVQGTGNNTCAFEFYLGTTGYWSFNPKLNGNSSSSTYAPNGTTLLETGISNGDWVRRTVTFGVRASSTSGKDEAYAVVSGLGAGASSPFTPLRFDRWKASSFLGRSATNPSSSYPYATKGARIYSIKVYYEV